MSKLSLAKEYRPDIDGLRAIAVLSIVLFHFDLFGFSGGFIGVDVFFVISGYLISRNIVGDMVEGVFSFSKFYYGRVRRIFPALYITLLATFLVGVLLFSPGQLILLSETAFYSIYSISNFLFWTRQGYFDPSGEFDPLLHTWSLAVEEQFYLMWPLLLFFGYRLFRNGSTFYLLLVVAAVSLGLAEWMLEKDPEGAFYLTPFRMAEFCIGGLCIHMPRIAAQKIWVAEISYSLGIGLILYALVVFDENTRFPGLNSLIPCVGTFLMIWSGAIARISVPFKSRLMVWFGLISYSLYLVHWPLWVFFGYWKATEISEVEKLSLLATAVFIGYLSYRYIERPFRGNGYFSKRTPSSNYALACSILALLLTFPVVSAWVHNGWIWRLPESSPVLNEQIGNSYQKDFGGDEFEWSDILGNDDTQPSFILIGDSHAKMMATGFHDELNARGLSARLNTIGLCLNLPGLTRKSNRGEFNPCTNSINTTLRLTKDLDAPIILAHRWWAYKMLIADRDSLEQITFDSDEEYIDLVVNKILELHDAFGDRRIFILGSVPEPTGKGDVINCLYRPQLIPSSCAKNFEFRIGDVGHITRINSELENLAEQNDSIEFIDPFDYFCKDGICSSVDTNGSLYSDGHHLSKHGSRLFAKKVMKDILSAIDDGTAD